MERRFCTLSKPHLRTDANGGKPQIAGYASVFYREGDPGTEYQLYQGFGFEIRERIMPGAFDRAIRECDVRALFNHDLNSILGRAQAGTLRLSIDSTGLRYEIDLPDTSMGRDVLESVRRGDVSGSSFAFDYVTTNTVETEDRDSGMMCDILEVRDVDLYDVGPVVYPAYTATTAGVRSLASEQGERLARERLERKRSALRVRMAAACIELGI